MFTKCSIFLKSSKGSELPRSFPELPRASPKFPRSFPDVLQLGGQPTPPTMRPFLAHAPPLGRSASLKPLSATALVEASSSKSEAHLRAVQEHPRAPGHAGPTVLPVADERVAQVLHVNSGLCFFQHVFIFFLISKKCGS